MPSAGAEAAADNDGAHTCLPADAVVDTLASPVRVDTVGDTVSAPGGRTTTVFLFTHAAALAAARRYVYVELATADGGTLTVTYYHNDHTVGRHHRQTRLARPQQGGVWKRHPHPRPQRGVDAVWTLRGSGGGGAGDGAAGPPPRGLHRGAVRWAAGGAGGRSGVTPPGLPVVKSVPKDGRTRGTTSTPQARRSKMRRLRRKRRMR